MNDTDDWFEVERLGEDTWRLAEAVVFSDYLVAGDERALVLDGSVGVGDLRTMVDRLVDVPVTMVLTHTHWDHVGAAHQFEDVLAHEAELPPDGVVRPDYVADEFNFELEDWVAIFLEEGGAFPDGVDPDSLTIRPAGGAEPATGGETVDLGGRELELLHLPGHSPGQLGALDRERGVLFGGDVIHLEHSVFAHFDGCDLRAYVDTFGRLCDLRDAGAFDTLYTAHNPPLSGEDLSLLDAFHEGLQAILAGDLAGEPTDERPPGIVYEVAGNEVIANPDAV